MEGERHEPSYEVIRSGHAGNKRELFSVLKSFLQESAFNMSHDGLYDIVVRDAEGNEFPHHITIDDALRTYQSAWSENEAAGTVDAIAARYENDLHARGLPGGNPHPIDVTIELRREAEGSL